MIKEHQKGYLATHIHNNNNNNNNKHERWENCKTEIIELDLILNIKKIYKTKEKSTRKK